MALAAAAAIAAIFVAVAALFLVSGDRAGKGTIAAGDGLEELIAASQQLESVLQGNELEERVLSSRDAARIVLLEDYIAEKKQKLTERNADAKKSELAVNLARLTNVGTFRAYMARYLKSLPKVHGGMTFLVRQLPPGANGIGLEVYVFSADQDWANYEAIQSDIFDHLLAILPEFELRVFQTPTGAELASFGMKGQS